MCIREKKKYSELYIFRWKSINKFKKREEKTTDKHIFIDINEIIMRPSSELVFSYKKIAIKIGAFVQNLCVDIHTEKIYKQIL